MKCTLCNEEIEGTIAYVNDARLHATSRVLSEKDRHRRSRLGVGKDTGWRSKFTTVGSPDDLSQDCRSRWLRGERPQSVVDDPKTTDREHRHKHEPFDWEKRWLLTAYSVEHEHTDEAFDAAELVLGAGDFRDVKTHVDYRDDRATDILWWDRQLGPALWSAVESALLRAQGDKENVQTKPSSEADSLANYIAYWRNTYGKDPSVDDVRLEFRMFDPAWVREALERAAATPGGFRQRQQQ